MASNPEEIIDGVVDREKALDVSWRFEPPHLPFALAGWLMGDLSPIVGILRGAVPPEGERRLVEHKRHSLSCRSNVL